MASILTLLTAKPILGFHNSSSVRTQFPALTIPKHDFTTSSLRLRVKQRLLLPIVFASDTNPSDSRDLLKEKSEASITSDSVSQGPPLLTILAGFVVLFVVLWVLGSIIVSLVGLIANL